MELPVNVSEPLLVNVRVDLGRSNIGMAEELLDDSQVGSILQKMSGKGVSEEVRVDFLGDARLPRSFLDDLPDTIRSQWPTPDGKKNLGGAVWFKEAGALVAEVALQRGSSHGNGGIVDVTLKVKTGIQSLFYWQISPGQSLGWP